MAQPSPVLPYRSDETDLRRLVEARARGRTLEQIRALGFAPKTFDGVVTTAQALSLVTGKEGELTGAGRAYSLASNEERPDLLSQCIQSYLPYALALEAVLLHGGPQPTPLEWLETWWAAHHFGSSQSNRAEAGPAFAKLVEAAGLGRYIQGRKGHPSRIEWVANASALPTPLALGARGDAAAPPAAPSAHLPSPAAALGPAGGPEEQSFTAALEPGTTSLHWVLAPGREVVLRLPSELTARERERVLRLLELLLQE